jgi:hypothetical protein
MPGGGSNGNEGEPKGKDQNSTKKTGETIKEGPKKEPNSQFPKLRRDLAEKVTIQKSREGYYVGDAKFNNEPLEKKEKRVQKVVNEIKGLKGIEEIVAKIETIEDLQNLDTKTLIRLEDKYEGILLYAFTDIVGDRKEKINFANWDLYKKPVPGMKLQVDFRGNQEAEAQIGAADLLPPSVRRITVYEEGDKSRARTSIQRVGLKGRNQSGAGFYDNDGYIPIFSHDVIEIGGNVDPQKGIDMEFENQFRTKNPDGTYGSLNEDSYNKYKHSKYEKDQKFLGDLLKRNPQAMTKKSFSEDEINKLLESIQGSGLGDKIAKFAIEIAKDPNKKGIRGEHCGDWIRKIYKAAGARSHVTIYSTSYIGNDCGKKHASPAQYDKIRPGDWLWYNNRNKAKIGDGNHSALFLSWKDKDNLIANVASGDASHLLRLHTANLREEPPGTPGRGAPVTRIMKPIG